MRCPRCLSNKIRKSGFRKKRQLYRCKECKRYFYQEIKLKKRQWYSAELVESVIDMRREKIVIKEIIERIYKAYKIVISQKTIVRWWKWSKSREYREAIKRYEKEEGRLELPSSSL